MTCWIRLGLAIGIILSISSTSFSQNLVEDEKQIRHIRASSNQALKNFDEELNNTFHTDDILIATGAGTLIRGKAELAAYLQNAKGPKMYWIRTPDEVLVNSDTNLAWERGTWKGYLEDSATSIVGGNYAAQWTKKSGTWLIQSQLFVTLAANK